MFRSREGLKNKSKSLPTVSQALRAESGVQRLFFVRIHLLPRLIGQKHMKGLSSGFGSGSARSLPFCRFCYWSVPLLPVRRGPIHAPEQRRKYLTEQADVTVSPNPLATTTSPPVQLP